MKISEKHAEEKFRTVGNGFPRAAIPPIARTFRSRIVTPFLVGLCFAPLAVAQHAAIDSLRAKEQIWRTYALEGDTARAFSTFMEYTALKDSLMRFERTKKVAEINAEYETGKQQQQIALLEKDKALTALELTTRQEELARQALLSAQQRQQMLLLGREKEIQRLEILNRTSDLQRMTAESERKQREVALLTKEKELLAQKHALQSSILARDRYVRNSAIAGLILLVIAGVVAYKRTQERRRSEALQAEAAEYKARAAEAQALALVAETERREKEIQKEFAVQLIASQERERKRVAAELHDGLGQELLVIGSRADLACEAGDEITLRENLRRIAQMAKSAVGDVRRISRNLRPVQLERAGITRTMKDMLYNLSSASAIKFETEIEPIDGVFAPEQEICLYRVVQEGVNNILKHSGAVSARVRVGRKNGEVRVEIRDDGRGFDSGTPGAGHGSKDGFGMQGLRERIGMLGGTLRVESGAGAGTVLTIAIPIPVPPEQAPMSEVSA